MPMDALDPEKPKPLELGEFMGNFQIIKQIGEGGCGVVYQVSDKRGNKYAMKLEPRKLKRTDQLLPLEAQVLKRLQFSPFATEYVQFARSAEHRLLVMGLLGPSLSTLQDEQENYQFSMSTVLRIGLQTLQAIGHLHSIFFIHRDIKPANLAIGLNDCRRIYLLDFGLTRALKKKDINVIRRKRDSVPFRGTPPYCSPNAHRRMEHGRHDDIWSLIYMLVDFATGNLPWHKHSRASTGALKAKLWDSEYMHGCPVIFSYIINYLRKLSFHDCPDYEGLERAFVGMMQVRGIKWNEPMDWETNLHKRHHAKYRTTKNAQLEVVDTGEAGNQSGTEKFTLSIAEKSIE